MSQNRNPRGNQPDDDDWGDDSDWDQTPRTNRRDDEDGFDDRYGSNPARRAPRRRSDDSNTPFILSIVGFFVCGILSIVAFIMAILQIKDAKKSGEPPSGLTIAAVVISSIHMLLMLLVLGLVLADEF